MGIMKPLLTRKQTLALVVPKKRNKERFPQDFMFQLTKWEWDELVANCDRLPNNIKHSSVVPLAFTQEGVAMLSGILRSPIAIQHGSMLPALVTGALVPGR